MGAGVSQTKINARIRAELQKLARQYNGTYANFRACGEFNGIKWEASYNTLRASNAEVASLPVYTANGFQSGTWEQFDVFLARVKAAQG